MPKLTDRLLTSLKVPPGKKDRLVFDTDCPGLGVRVTAAGTRKFIVQWSDKATGKKRREALGVWGSITIAAAREAARAILGDAARGHDRVADRERQKAAADVSREEARLTLDKLISEWADKHLSQRRANYTREAQRALRYAFVDHLRKPAARLSRANVIAVLDKLAQSGKGTMAGRTMAYGRSMCAWAVKRETLKENPFHRLPIAATKSERDRVLTDAELADIRAAAEALPYPWGPFYLVALFTLQRREEVAGMLRSELAPDLSLWSIAADRMKNNRAHDVHLSKPVRDVLRALPAIEGQELVFSTNGRMPVSGYSKAKRMLDAKIEEMRAAAAKAGTEPAAPAPWRLHDFRRSGVSKLAALGFDSIVADKLLAHKAAKLKGVAAIYQRHEFLEERKRALEAWAAFLTRSRDGATVLPFPTKAGA